MLANRKTITYSCYYTTSMQYIAKLILRWLLLIVEWRAKGTLDVVMIYTTFTWCSVFDTPPFHLYFSPKLKCKQSYQTSAVNPKVTRYDVTGVHITCLYERAPTVMMIESASCLNWNHWSDGLWLQGTFANHTSLKTFLGIFSDDNWVSFMCLVNVYWHNGLKSTKKKKNLVHDNFPLLYSKKGVPNKHMN